MVSTFYDNRRPSNRKVCVICDKSPVLRRRDLKLGSNECWEPGLSFKIGPSPLQQPEGDLASNRRAPVRIRPKPLFRSYFSELLGIREISSSSCSVVSFPISYKFYRHKVGYTDSQAWKFQRKIRMTKREIACATLHQDCSHAVRTSKTLLQRRNFDGRNSCFNNGTNGADQSIFRFFWSTNLKIALFLRYLKSYGSYSWHSGKGRHSKWPTLNSEWKGRIL